MAKLLTKYIKFIQADTSCVYCSWQNASQNPAEVLNYSVLPYIVRRLKQERKLYGNARILYVLLFNCILTVIFAVLQLAYCIVQPCNGIYYYFRCGSIGYNLFLSYKSTL